MTTSERLVYLLGQSADIITLLGTLKVYNGVAPQRSTFDYIIYSISFGQSIITQDDSDNRLKGRTYTFKAYSIGDATMSGEIKVYRILAAIRAAFRNVSERPGIQSITPGLGPVDLGWAELQRAYGVAQEFQVWSDLD